MFNHLLKLNKKDFQKKKGKLRERKQ